MSSQLVGPTYGPLAAQKYLELAGNPNDTSFDYPGLLSQFATDMKWICPTFAYARLCCYLHILYIKKSSLLFLDIFNNVGNRLFFSVSEKLRKFYQGIERNMTYCAKKLFTLKNEILTC